MKDLRVMGLAAYAPYHAQHLYTPQDIDSLLDLEQTMDWAKFNTKLVVVSSVTGLPTQN